MTNQEKQLNENETRLLILDELHRGNPVVWGMLVIAEHERELEHEKLIEVME